MRFTTLFLFLFFQLNGWTQTSSTLRIQPQLSKVSWTGYAEIGSWAPTGTVQVQSGTITVQNGEIQNGTLVIALRTIQHEIGQLEKHLKGPDFFDTKKYPTATFQLTKMSDKTAIGQLTIKKTTKTVRIPLELEQSENQLVLRGKILIDRTAFGIRYNSGSYFDDLGDQAIKNEFLVVFELVAN